VDGGGLKKTHLPLRCKRLSQLHTTDIRRTYLPRKQTNFTKPPPLLFFFAINVAALAEIAKEARSGG